MFTVQAPVPDGTCCNGCPIFPTPSFTHFTGPGLAWLGSTVVSLIPFSDATYMGILLHTLKSSSFSYHSCHLFSKKMTFFGLQHCLSAKWNILCKTLSLYQVLCFILSLILYHHNLDHKVWHHITAPHDMCDLKGELQHQNKLISSERLFKILKNETKIIKIGHAVLEIFNFKD